MRACDPANRYRPQWAFATPEGSRDEDFIVGPFPISVPFTGALLQNWPVHMDDDVPFYIRAILLENDLGTGGGFAGFAPGSLIRIRDCFGNPLSDGLVLAMGNWANAFFNGPGWPMEPEVQCSPGGTMLFDIQATSDGAAASFTLTVGPESIQFVATIMGAAGNTAGFTIALVNPGAPNHALTIAVVGRAVTVTLATNGGGAITSTFADVQAIINGTPAAIAQMFAILAGPTPNAVITALVLSPLAGGSDGATQTVYGSFQGVKRFEDCA